MRRSVALKRYALKDMYAKFGAFTRFVTIFVNFDANGLVYLTRSLHVKRPTLSRYHMTAWPCYKIPPPLPGALKAKFGLDLITCTPRDEIHVVYYTGEPLHYSQIRSFKIPTIPSPILPFLREFNFANGDFCVCVCVLQD